MFMSWSKKQIQMSLHNLKKNNDSSNFCVYSFFLQIFSTESPSTINNSNNLKHFFPCVHLIRWNLFGIQYPIRQAEYSGNGMRQVFPHKAIVFKTFNITC